MGVFKCKPLHLVTEIRTINPDLKAYTFINRADPKGQDNNDAADVLKETDALTFIEIALGMRKAFSNAAATGLAVTELKPKDLKAINEIATLFQYIFNVKLTLLDEEN
jgi:chromosome partitioning protein